MEEEASLNVISDESLAETVPISLRFKPDSSDEGYFVEKKMCLFIPFDHQDNPPLATDSEVIIIAKPEMRVYAR